MAVTGGIVEDGIRCVIVSQRGKEGRASSTISEVIQPSGTVRSIVEAGANILTPKENVKYVCCHMNLCLP